MGVTSSNLPLVTSGTEDDEIIANVSGGTRRISFKTILEKISFKSLTTNAKNIIGAINELTAKTSKDLRLSPVSLYTGNLCNSALGSYVYATVDNLNKYQEIGIKFRIGDALTVEERFNANTFSQKTYSAYISNTYNGRIAIYVDFAQNLIGIKTISKAGWEYEYLSITNVYGYLLK